jgi:hypothetical protein
MIRYVERHIRRLEQTRHGSHRLSARSPAELLVPGVLGWASYLA